MVRRISQALCAEKAYWRHLDLSKHQRLEARHGRWGSVHLDSIGSHSVVLSFSPISNPCPPFFGVSCETVNRLFGFLSETLNSLHHPLIHRRLHAKSFTDHVCRRQISFAFPTKRWTGSLPLNEVRTTMNH